MSVENSRALFVMNTLSRLAQKIDKNETSVEVFITSFKKTLKDYREKNAEGKAINVFFKEHTGDFKILEPTKKEIERVEGEVPRLIYISSEEDSKEKLQEKLLEAEKSLKIGKREAVAKLQPEERHFEALELVLDNVIKHSTEEKTRLQVIKDLADSLAKSYSKGYDIELKLQELTGSHENINKVLDTRSFLRRFFDSAIALIKSIAGLEKKGEDVKPVKALPLYELGGGGNMEEDSMRNVPSVKPSGGYKQASGHKKDTSLSF